MNAQEARKLSEKKSIDLDSVLKSIEQQADCGFTDLNLYGYIKDDVRLELMGLQYKISFHTDAINGTKSLLISW